MLALTLAPDSLLLASTDDPGAATTNAVARPKPGTHPLRWYRDTKPRFYRPYMVRVLALDDSMMELVFLHGRTGEDLALSKPSFRIAYHDGRYAHSALPSTAQKARPGTEQDCGLLFISDLYMESLTQSDRTTLVDTGGGEGKWPPSAGKFSELIERLHGQLGANASTQDAAELAALVELLKSVA
jgi:hypothetical protein